MKINSTVNNVNSSLIILKNDEWLAKQRIAGKVVAGVLAMLCNLVKEKTNLSLLEMDKMAEEFIRKNGCTPTFLGYRGFPASVCCSVGKSLVHGIPTDYKLQEHDIVSFDTGANFEEVPADSATTVVCGEYKSERHYDLVKTTKECLELAISSISAGQKLGVIGHTIYKHATSKGYSVITKYAGHGINSNQVHAPPFVANKASMDEGPMITEGLSIAIEPLLVIGYSTNTQTMQDGWTVVCDNICSHEEHSVYIHKDRVEIITEN